MNERTDDGIVWDGLPHPDPELRHARVRVELSPAFTGAGIDALHAALQASLADPLTLWFEERANDDGGGYYLLIMTNGALAVLRPKSDDAKNLVLEDCFFPDPIGRSDTLRALAVAAHDPASRERTARLMFGRFADLDGGGAAVRQIHPQPVRFVTAESWKAHGSHDATLFWNARRAGGRGATSDADALQEAVLAGLGKLFGSGDHDRIGGQLTAGAALVAAREIQPGLDDWTRRAMMMHRRSSRRSRAFDQNVCLGLLEHRMGAWAAFIAIDATYGVALENGNEGTSPSRLSDEIDRVMNAIDAFDDALMGVESRWVPMVRSTNLLRNWHALLAAPFQASPPWWMTAALTPDRRFAFSSPCIG